eukprot:535238_1
MLISNEDPWWYSFIQGYSGGLITILCGHPFETIKTRIQTSATKDLFRNLYRGVTPPLIFTTLSWSANFYAYQQCLKLLSKYKSSSDITKDDYICDVFIAGGLSGVVWSTCVTPIELIRNYSQRYHIKATQSVVYMYSNFGLTNFCRILYRGYTSSLMRDVPGCAIYFGVLESVRKYLPNYDNSISMHIIGGSITGLVHLCCCLPPDAIKSNIQTQFGFNVDMNCALIKTSNCYSELPTANFITNGQILLNKHNRNIFKFWSGFRWMSGKVIIASGINIAYQEWMASHLLHN